MDTSGEAEAAALVALLCSTSKLDRDKGAAQLARTSPSALPSVSQQLDTLAEDPNLSWEQKLGYLQGNTCLLSVDTNLGKCDDRLNKLILFSLDWLELEPEVRVKAAVGDLLESLCRLFGEMVFDSCRGKVSCLIKNHLARNIDPDKDVTAEMGPGGVTGKLMNRAEWKNLAAWKDLEVTLGCLGKMFQGLGEAASSRLDQEVLALVFSCCSHHNRFVRDTGYKVCTVLLAAAGDGAGAELGGEMSGHLAAGLADSWALVRLSATQAAAQFLAGGRGRAQHHAQLLPRLCLNRYYPAEGVRLAAQRAWVSVCGAGGRALLARQLAATLAYYSEAAASRHQPAREAACHCLAELASKLDTDTVAPHLAAILDTLTERAARDECWPVRDVACVAASSVVAAAPEVAACRARLQPLLATALANMEHSLHTVRQGAAIAIANIVRADPDSAISDVLAKIRQGLQGIRNQLSNCDSSPQENGSSLLTVAAATTGDIGGCTESAVTQRPPQPWEVAEGCVLALSSLSAVRAVAGEAAALLPAMFASCQHRHYPAHLSYCTTVVTALATIASHLDKRHLKPILELDVIFLVLESESSRGVAAGEECLRVLGRVLGPNILRGRVEQCGGQHLAAHDRVMAGAAPGLGPPSGAPSRPIAIPSRRPSQYSSLGGTPPT